MKSWESRKTELAGRLDQLKAELSRGLGYGDATYVGQVQLEGSRIAGVCHLLLCLLSILFILFDVPSYSSRKKPKKILVCSDRHLHFDLICN